MLSFLTDGAAGMLGANGFEPEFDNGLPVEELGFWKRQYIFAAATMPAGGKGSVRRIGEIYL